MDGGSPSLVVTGLSGKDDDLSRVRCPKVCKAMLDKCGEMLHLDVVIGSVRHRGLRDYWTRGLTKGLNGDWVQKVRRIMSALEAAERPEQMNYPGSRYHQLRGNMVGRYAVRLTANYRVTFGWDEDKALDVDIEDYH